MSAAMAWLARPWWLLALLPLALLAWRLRHASSADDTAWRKMIDAHLLPHLLVRGAPQSRRLGVIAVTGGLLLAVLALAGPTLDRYPGQAYRSNAMRVLVVDLSSDMAPHLDRVKLKILDLLRALPDGQTALLVYAGEPYLVAPPSTDTETIALFIPELATDVVPAAGNRPEHALRMASNLLARNAATARDIVWITTGTLAAALPAPELANARLLILHAVPADALVLAAARSTNGMTVRLSSDNDDIRQLVAAFASDGGRSPEHAWRNVTDIGYWLVLPLLPLAAFAFRRGVLALLVVSMLLAGFAPQRAEAIDLPAFLSDVQARRLFQSGQYQAAAERFADPRWRAAASYRAGQYEQAASVLKSLRDADALYNRGNALARQGRLADALAAYESSLDLRPNDLDTLHNRDLVRSLLNQQRSGSQGGGTQRIQMQQAASDIGREAAELAEQWLRGVADEPGGLLRRKLLIEHQRRRAGEVP